MSKHLYIVGIGSNFDKETNVKKAAEWLKNAAWAENLQLSPAVETAPIGMDGPTFLNQIAQFSSALDEAELKAKAKAAERNFGRKPEEKSAGIVRIDIDILKRDDVVLKKDFNFPFVQNF